MSEDNDIKELEVLNAHLSTPSQTQSNNGLDTPIAALEAAVSQFVSHSFETSRKNDAFNDALQQEVLKRMYSGQLSNDELLAMLTNSKGLDNERLNKLMQPTFTLITEKHRAEIAAMAEVKKEELSASSTANTNFRELNSQMTDTVLQGFTQLKNFMDSFTVTQEDDEKKEI